MNTVLCFSHLRWDFVFQRPQHLMTRFARSHRVYYIEEPVETDATQAPSLAKRRDVASGVIVVTPQLPRGTAGTHDAQLRELLTTMMRDERIVHPLCWYYTPMMLAQSAHIAASCIVYDCMDELANFNFAPTELVFRERELLAAAQVVFTGGASLFERKRSLHGNVHLFPSSVDVSHFQAARQLRVTNQNQSESASPRFGFHGVIDERMDLELLAAVADARPDWTWDMIGPVVKIDAAQLPRRNNINYLGAQPYASLPQFLATWDVAMMPFAINDATRYISPTKTPEYLAGGLPVVSTPVRDVMARYGHLEAVKIGSTAQEFVYGCEQALKLRRATSATDKVRTASGIGKSTTSSEPLWLRQVDAELSADSWDSTFEQMQGVIRAATQKIPAGPGAGASRSNVLGRTHYDYLIVGAGFAGSVLAERLARQSGRKVLVIDRRDHIGGNAYDEFDEAGILVHRYGPHIFHTNSDRIHAYLSRFTEWLSYEHRVLASVRDKLVPIPINRTTINMLYNLNFQTDREVAEFLQDRAVSITEVKTAEDMMLSTIGSELYELFFRCYTQKQWGMHPSQLDKAVTARVPARANTDDRYFTDKHQCMPLHGYTRMFENMLNHDNITVMTNVDYATVRHDTVANHTIFTGPIDEYFDYQYGPLPYRSLEFRRETLNQKRFQPVAVVNYPSAEQAYTRITEYTHLTGQSNNRTSISYEYPSDTGEPYYPIPSNEAQALYRKYAQLAANRSDVTFAGRLGTYRYYNMDQVVGQALTIHHRLEENPAQAPLRDNLLLRAFA